MQAHVTEVGLSKVHHKSTFNLFDSSNNNLQVDLVTESKIDCVFRMAKIACLVFYMFADLFIYKKNTLNK